MKDAIVRFPIAGGGLAVYRASGDLVEVRREDADAQPVASMFLELRELAGLVHVLEIASVALRPGREREDVPAHVLELLAEAERDDGSMGWYGAEIERRARGDA